MADNDSIRATGKARRCKYASLLANARYGNICNMCGKPLDEWDEQEEFGFDYGVGYGSKFDEERLVARFCCGCFDKIIDRLRGECVISPLVGECTIECGDEPQEAPQDIDNITVMDE